MSASLKFGLKSKHFKALYAIVEQPNMRKAAAISGVPLSTLYRWVRENQDFRRELSFLWQDAYSTGLKQLEGTTPYAVRILREIMVDSDASPQTRAQAARAVVQQAIKLAQIRVEEAKALREHVVTG